MTNLTASAVSAQTFLSGIGVCTHIPYTDGGYAQINNVIAQLESKLPEAYRVGRVLPKGAHPIRLV